jgi:hypothetical protein
VFCGTGLGDENLAYFPEAIAAVSEDTHQGSVCLQQLIEDVRGRGESGSKSGDEEQFEDDWYQNQYHAFCGQIQFGEQLFALKLLVSGARFIADRISQISQISQGNSETVEKLLTTVAVQVNQIVKVFD